MEALIQCGTALAISLLSLAGGIAGGCYATRKQTELITAVGPAIVGFVLGVAASLFVLMTVANYAHDKGVL